VSGGTHHHRKAGHRQPLGDAEKKENARGRTAGAAKTKAAPMHHPAARPTMGAKQSSSRFKS